MKHFHSKKLKFVEQFGVRDHHIKGITAEEEYKKNPDLKKEDVQALRTWMTTQAHLPQDAPGSEFSCIGPKTPQGYQVIFHRLHQNEPSKYVFQDSVKILSMSIDACLHVEGTVPGYIFLFDMAGVRLGHLLRLNLGLLSKFFQYIQSRGSYNSIQSSSPVLVNGAPILFVERARNLGVIFNCDFTWGDHVSHVRKKVFGVLWRLKRSSDFFSLATRSAIIRSYVLPHFDYCSSVIYNMSLEQKTRLQRAQNACVRFVYKARLREHITPYFNRLGLMKLEDREKILLLNITYKILSSESPPYLSSKYTFRSEVSSRETRAHPLSLQIPISHTTSYQNSFLTSSINLWNSLPYIIVNSPSISLFRSSLLRAVKNGHFSRTLASSSSS
ncbi:hypothetical protein WDU94_010159 [Cyamophila willieti]